MDSGWRSRSNKLAIYFDGCLLKIDAKYFQSVRLGNSQKAIGIAPRNQYYFFSIQYARYHGFQKGLSQPRVDCNIFIIICSFLYCDTW